MSLIKGENSYVSLEEAATYMADKVDVAEWDEATDILREKALITATRYLDEKEWRGVIIDKDQHLAFPRNCTYFEPKFGFEITETAVPRRILEATIELAYHLIYNDGLLDDEGRVENIHIGSIEMHNIQSPSKIPVTVRNLIKPLLKNSSRSWWRAN
jgi:hypothetical protein